MTSSRHVADVHSGDDDLAAFEVAAAVLRTARDKGFPAPVTTTVRGDRIELGLLWPHLLQWCDMFDGFGQANLPAGHEHGRLRMQVVPGHHSGDYSVHGWTWIDGEGGRKQQWVLRPVIEHDCRRCVELPDPIREPVGVDAWANRAWFDLTGRRWEERTVLLG